MSCDAGVVEVLEDEHGVPLSVGRKRRTISGALKRALWKRDRVCTFPGCTNGVFLEGHHIRHWADGGETSLSNACLMCTLHHRWVHEHGYSVEMGDDQRPRYRDPAGRLVPEVPDAPVAARGDALGWPAIVSANAGLGIDADRNAPGWDGSTMPYGTLVMQLARIDGL